jgi:SAM-dependent methyltransferase
MPKDPTRDYYEEHAQGYFNQTYDVNLQPLWTQLRQELEPRAFILDLGCGSGRDVRYFADQGFRVVGVDYAANLLRLAKDFTQQPLVLGNFHYPPFRDSAFDAVWAIGSLLHIRRQVIPYVLAQIHRILKEGAILFTSVKKGCGEGMDSQGRYNVFYLRHEWKDILKEQAYDIIGIEETVEIRENKPGHIEEITWITCLARAYELR